MCKYPVMEMLKGVMGSSGCLVAVTENGIKASIWKEGLGDCFMGFKFFTINQMGIIQSGRRLGRNICI